MTETEAEGPEFEATARLARSLKGRMARRAIESQQDLEATPYTVSELLGLDALELRMANRREVDELNRLVAEDA